MTASAASKIADSKLEYAAKPDQATDALRALESIGEPNLPTFARADSARRAGRLNASAATDEELNALLQERKKILDKKFSASLTRQEENRLQYVRWSIERIEDARHGHELDRLEAAIDRYEQFYSDLKALRAQLAQYDKAQK